MQAPSAVPPPRRRPCSSRYAKGARALKAPSKVICFCSLRAALELAPCATAFGRCFLLTQTARMGRSTRRGLCPRSCLNGGAAARTAETENLRRFAPFADVVSSKSTMKELVPRATKSTSQGRWLSPRPRTFARSSRATFAYVYFTTCLVSRASANQNNKNRKEKIYLWRRPHRETSFVIFARASESPVLYPQRACLRTPRQGVVRAQ